MSMHDLRHTFASHLILDLKLDVVTVSRQLGHARPSITSDVYGHLFDRARHPAGIRKAMGESNFGLVRGLSYCVNRLVGRWSVPGSNR